MDIIKTIIQYKYDIVLLALFMLITLIFFTLFQSYIDKNIDTLDESITTKKVHDELVISSVYS